MALAPQAASTERDGECWVEGEGGAERLEVDPLLVHLVMQAATAATPTAATAEAGALARMMAAASRALLVVGCAAVKEAVETATV